MKKIKVEIAQLWQFLLAAFFPGLIVLSISFGLAMSDLPALVEGSPTYFEILMSVVSGVRNVIGMDFFLLSAYWAGAVLVITVVELILNHTLYFQKQTGTFYLGTKLGKDQWRYHSLITTGEFAGSFAPTPMASTTSILSILGSNSMAAERAEAELFRRILDEAEEIKRAGGSIVYHDPKADPKMVNTFRNLADYERNELNKHVN